MNCPLCLDTVLDVTYHAGIELDICPKCRGVWLDRGELNRIVDEMDLRSGGSSPARRDDRSRQPRAADRQFERRAERDDDRSGNGHSDRGRKKRKQSFASRLGDVFEEIVDL